MPRGPVRSTCRTLARTFVPLGCLVVALLLTTPPSSWEASPGQATARMESTHPFFPSAAPSTTSHDLTVVPSSPRILFGPSISFNVLLPVGVTGSRYVWNFGDASSATGTTPSVSHSYSSAGLYAVTVNVTDITGGYHDNLLDVAFVSILASASGDWAGNLLFLQGVVVSNSSSSQNATTLLAPGQSVTLRVDTTNLPTGEGTVLGQPGLALGSAIALHTVFSNESLNGSSESEATVTFDSTTPYWMYPIVYSVPTTTFINGSLVRAWSNYTFTIGIGYGLSGSLRSPVASFHSGKLVAYELGTGANSVDPALDYDARGAEVDANVAQTLITYNRSLSGPATRDFLPELATCVPGSAACLRLYGSTLVAGSNFTFVISNATKFYDPQTGAAWAVYPSDVYFSIVRALAFSDLPCVGCGPGWILAQSLLASGSPSWDQAIHSPYNTTPNHILTALSVNDSACAALPGAMTADHGCVTFHVNGLGQSWPEFLAFLAQPWGATIVPCGWYSAPAQGQAIPGWTSGEKGAGDHPCLLLGNSTATDQTSFTTALFAMTATEWDAWEYDYSGAQTGSYPGNTTTRLVGSGPYYLGKLLRGVGYSLQANPYYAANPDCSWPGCPPARASLIASVNVTWEGGSAAQGLTALSYGDADVAEIPQPQAAQLLPLIDAGTVGVSVTPSTGTSFLPLDLNYSLQGAKNLTHATSLAPSTVLTDLNLRQFLVNSFPYRQSSSQNLTTRGIPFSFLYGGAIPQFVDGYSPQNITWPTGDPDISPTDVGGAAWWWNQTAHDAMAGAACSSTTPCNLPASYLNGDNTTRDLLRLWQTWAARISGGAVQLDIVNLTLLQWISVLFSAPGTNPVAIGPGSGWSLDYSDPSDPVLPLYVGDSTYTFPNAVAEEFFPLNGTSCSTDYRYWAALSGPIPESCQGAAFDAMNSALGYAATVPLGATRAEAYNLAEKVAAKLALYVYTGQANAITPYASWLDPQTLNHNPMLGGADIQTWFSIRYASHAWTAVGPSIASFIASPSILDYGVSTTLDAVLAGGSAPFSYSFVGVPGCGRAVTSSARIVQFSCQPAVTGTFHEYLNVTDILGLLGHGEIVIVVNPVPSVSSFSVSAIAVDEGFPLTYTVAISGGTAPETVAYTTLPTGCLSANRTVLVCTPQVAGNYRTTVRVTDADGNTATAQTTTTVVSRIVIVGIALSPSSVNVGSTLSGKVTVTGGVAPLRYSWAGLPSGCSDPASANLTCVPTQSGTFNVSVTVTDAWMSAAQNVTLEVSPKPVSPTPFLSGVVLYGLFGTGAAAAAIAGGLLARRRRRTSAGGIRAPSRPGSSGLFETAPVGEEHAVGPAMAYTAPEPGPGATAPDLGASLEGAPLEGTLVEGAPQAPGSQVATIICRNCGYSNPPWVYVCENCRRSLETTGDFAPSG